MLHWLYQLRQYRIENPLAVRLLAYILLFSSVITLTSTATQLYLDYRNDLELIEDRIRQLEATSLNELANQVWLINDERIRAQLDGLSQLPDLQYLQLDTQFDERFTAGNEPGAEIPLLTRRYPLSHTTAEGESYQLGELTVMFSLERVYRNLKDRVLVIFASQGVKTFLVSIFILYIFWKLVTQHLGTLSRYARALTPEALDDPLVLHRRRHPRDELAEVVSAINTMRESLKEDISQRIQAEQALAELNERLEARVQQRTRELQQANSELSNTLAELQNTQSQLVESEKMAALGNLVAGVAHEINTPIGIGLTAASYLQDQADSYRQRQDEHPLVAIAAEGSDLITTNLKRAAQLVNAFKQVSADQSSEQARYFMMREYLDEILLSMAPRLKQSQPAIEIDCPPDLRLFSFPGALYQILANLIQNSLIHGFEEQPGGTISIKVRTDNDATLIDYRDNGSGISDGIRSQVFNPFFTTRRHQGSTGLGLHIAYNLSTQRLGGELRCLGNDHEHPEGARFQLRIATETRPEQPLVTP